MQENVIYLRDWSTHASVEVEVHRISGVFVLGIKVFWVECIGQNVLAVAVGSRRYVFLCPFRERRITC